MQSIDNIIFLLILGVFSIFILQGFIRALRLVPARTEFIIERFGQYNATLGAGFHFLIPLDNLTSFKGSKICNSVRSLKL